MDQNFKQELLKKLNEVKPLVYDLRNSCQTLHNEKEKWYTEKQKCSEQIKALLGAIKESKTKRDSFTQMVKDKKVERNDLNEKVKEKIDALKALEHERETVLKKNQIKDNPAFIKRKIEQMDFKMQTEAISFNKEQEMMKAIKALKQQYKEMAVVHEVEQKIHHLKNEISQVKQEANLSHHVIQSTAQESQKKHEALVDTAKQIEDLRQKEKEAFDKFTELKKQYHEKNTLIKEKQKEMKSLFEQLDLEKEQYHKQRQDRDQETMQERRKQVNEKLKKGMKLTTKDLIAFQGNDEENEDTQE